MSSDRRKQEIEGKAFEQFCRLLPFSIEWRHGVRHGDEPDIIATVAGQRIGVEVTGLTDEDFQRSSVTNNRFAEAVQAACVNRGLPSVHVSLHGIRSEALNPRNAPAAAKRIVDFIETFAPFERPISLGEAELPKDIAIYIGAFGLVPPLGNVPVCVGSLSRWTPEIARADIERVVERKKEKRSRYTVPFEEAWLLITSNDLASIATMTEEAANAEYQSDFDRLFVLTESKGLRVWQLNKSGAS